MNDTQPILHPQDEPATYAIRVKGHLPDRWGEWFGDVTVGWEADGVTRLTCPATDQAALYGLLKRIRDLGLPLVSVNPVQPGPADVADDESKKE